ncbi:MAG: guanylate kinase [Candidatus Omnitrophota bacterium]
MAAIRKSLIVIVSAPSGSGKTTIVSRLLERMDGIKRCITCTTRKPREGEKDKEEYIFLSGEEFSKMRDNGEFLEWEENFGNFYGTPEKQFNDAMETGTDIILSIDVKGAREVKNIFPESVSVFVMPPSTEELETRLRKRNTDGEKAVSLRLQESQREIAAADEYDYLIMNEKVEEAVEELKCIIESERKKLRQYSAKG